MTDPVSAPVANCDRCGQLIKLRPWGAGPPRRGGPMRWVVVERPNIIEHDSNEVIVRAVCGSCLDADSHLRYGVAYDDRADLESDRLRAAKTREDYAALSADDDALWRTIVDRRRQLLLGDTGPSRKQGRGAAARGLPRDVREINDLPVVVAHVESLGELVRCGVFLHTRELHWPQTPEPLRDAFPFYLERPLALPVSWWMRPFERTSRIRRPRGVYMLSVRDVPAEDAVEIVGELRAHADQLQAVVLAEALAHEQLPIVESWRFAATAVDQVPAITADAENAAIVAERTHARDEVARTVAELREVAKP